MNQTDSGLGCVSTDHLHGLVEHVTARKSLFLVSHGALRVSLLADHYCRETKRREYMRCVPYNATGQNAERLIVLSFYGRTKCRFEMYVRRTCAFHSTVTFRRIITLNFLLPS